MPAVMADISSITDDNLAEYILWLSLSLSIYMFIFFSGYAFCMGWGWSPKDTFLDEPGVVCMIIEVRSHESLLPHEYVILRPEIQQ